MSMNISSLVDHGRPVDPQRFGKDVTAMSTPRLPVQEERRRRFWWSRASLISTSKATRRKKTLTRQKRQLNLRPVTPVIESPSSSGSLVKSRLEEVRRNTMEKSLEAVIQEAKMELEQEKRTSVRMWVSSFHNHHYQNIHKNIQNCSTDENSNIYQNTSFHRKLINYNYPTPIGKDKDYEVMSFRRLSGPYIEMTPGKLVTSL